MSPGHHDFLRHSEPGLERTVRALVDVGGVFGHISGGSIILTLPTVTAVRQSTTLYIPFVLIEKHGQFFSVRILLSLTPVYSSGQACDRSIRILNQFLFFLLLNSF